MKNNIYLYKWFYITKAVYHHDAWWRFSHSDMSFFVSKAPLEQKYLMLMIWYCEAWKSMYSYTECLDIELQSDSLAECKAFIDLQEFRIV